MLMDGVRVWSEVIKPSHALVNTLSKSFAEEEKLKKEVWEDVWGQGRDLTCEYNYNMSIWCSGFYFTLYDILWQCPIV